LAAVARDDAADAAHWLLLRDFRPTTTLSRPGADATLAVRKLGAGALTPEQTAAAVRGDLLDTYQAQLEAELNDIAGAAPDKLLPTQAEAVGLAAGHWPVLAGAYEAQQGADARAQADAVFAALPAAVANGDTAAFGRALTDATAIATGFRAAPLTEAEQARRAGQLLRYLSLVPIEYGRGVHAGQVTLDLEIEEARAFLDGARGAFADLRLSLQAQDAAATREVAASLGRLDAALSATTTREAVASPATIEADAGDAAARLQKLFSPAWLRPGADADFDVIDSLLDQVEAAVAAGQYRQADATRLEAYAIFETGPEKRLLAFAPQHAQRVEQLFWEGNGQTRGLADLIATESDLSAIRATRQTLDAALTDAQERLGSGEIAPAAIIFNAATIVFREGLEAVLILASLLASMIGANRLYRRPLAFGAGAALVVTAILFFLTGRLLLGLSQYSEQVEAIVSLVAIGVLLLVMNWFFHKVYWTRWIAKHHDRRRRLLIGGAAGQALGLAMLGFTSVFREGAETVLFLQALVLDAGTWLVVQGVVLGLAGTAVVGVL
ncbi:MAG TPA: FTR1 family protein, partial [Thermomicrobiales bacterium]|nr:FTR1 family protein [Thermomicrobiales bacterium]